MAPTTEPTTAAEEHETSRQNNSGNTPASEVAGGQLGGPLGGVFTGAFGEPPADTAARFFGNSTLSLSPNHSFRNIALKRAQQNHGNHFVQRAVNGISRDVDVVPNGSTGKPLHEGPRRLMESRFGRDFGDVRIHTDDGASASAEALSANAFTSGRDIYFARGKYQLDSLDGQRLLAHELVHTVQQEKSPTSQSSALPISSPGDPLELEADRAADALIQDPRPAGPGEQRGTGSALDQRVSQQVSSPVIQRDDDKSLLTAVEYLEKYSSHIAVSLNVLMPRTELGTGSPYASWTSGNSRSLGDAMWNLPEMNVLPTLRALLQPLAIENLVNRGRDLHVEVDPQGSAWQSGSGKDAWFPDVATELQNALIAQLNKSLQRIMPRYVARRYRLKMALPKKSDSSLVPEPSPSDIVPSHPMDRLVINGLCQGGKVTIDYDLLSADKPAFDEPWLPGTLRPVTFEFQGGKGAWFWLLVKSPLDATTEEVADTLYGDSAQAFRLVNAAPLFGFTAVSLLQQTHQDKLKEMSADPNIAQSALYPHAKEWAGEGAEPGNLDPVAELTKGPLADDAALNQAGKLKAPSGTDKDKVLDNMRLSFEVLDGMIPNAKRFHEDGRLVEARGAIETKRALLSKADDVEVMRWAAQSAEQKKILAGASAGLAEAVAQLDHLLSADKLAHGHELADYVKSPLLDVATAYVTAAAQSFFVGSGAAALAAAEGRSRMFGVELMEGILRAVSHNIEIAEKDKTGEKTGGNEAEFGISKLRDREKDLRQRLRQAREVILRNPDQLNDLLEKIYADVADLQVEVGIVANLDAIDSAQKALFDSQDWWSDIVNREYELRSGYLQEVAAWRVLWKEVYDTWNKGEHEKAKERFRQLVTAPQFKSLFERVANYVEDAAAWALVARLVGLIAITVVTWGVGTYFTALGATAWGGAAAASGELTAGAATAGFVAGTVAEAVTFTTLNTLLLDPDPTLKGFLTEFAFNLALFGILRKLSMMYRGAAAVKAASAAGRTTLVAAGEMGITWATLNVATLARAEIEKRLKHQENLTTGEIGEILLKSTAMFIGLAVTARVAGPLMKELAASGSTMGVRLRLINAQRARMAVIAEATGSNGDIAQARALIVQDRAELQAEIDFYEQVLKTPEVLAEAGYTAEQIKSLRDTGEAQILEINVAESMIQAEQIGGNEYQMPLAKLRTALEAHAKAGATLTLLRHDESAKTETWSVKPAKGPELRLTTKVPNSTEVQLNALRGTLSPEGQEAFDRFAESAITPERALEQLDKMSKSKKGLEDSVVEAAKKLPVRGMVPGLYPGVKLDPQQGPWTFSTTRQESTSADGTRVITVTTNVTLTTPQGETHTAGPVMRTITIRPNAAGGYDVDVTMDMAFLEGIPSELRWVNEFGVPISECRGIPLQTYVTLMQMRMESVGLGQVTTAHLSTIINARTLCELAAFRQKYAPGVPANRLPSKLIEQTQSGIYGMTNVTQAGAKVKGMRIQGGHEETVDSVVRGSDMNNDAKLAELGLSRSQKILTGFDIVIDIEPPTTPSSGSNPGKP